MNKSIKRNLCSLLIIVIVQEAHKYEENTSFYLYIYDLKYITDIDRDGERTVLDATAIQLKIAKK